jgi:phenylalanyl-tRNA synthetase beta chain
MRISWNWLSRHVDLSDIDPQELGEQFTLKVAELDDIFEMGADLQPLRAVHITDVSRVEGTDKLTQVIIQDGDKSHTVVCGAPNAMEAVGRIAVLAPPGSVLPDGTEIRVAEVRGVQSYGMLASERELGLSDDHSGIMLLGNDTQAGQSLLSAIPLQDWIFELDNKAITHRPDLWGHYGIAREIALLAGRELRPLDPQVDFGSENRVSAQIHDFELCPRYLCAYISGVKVAESPEWLKCLLRAAGVRPISNVVDLTNFVMLDTGNPLHAFDARFVAGHQIHVRRANDGEVIRTLDGQDHRCDNENLLICDAEKPVALAGIMGGENSEIRDDTSEVILEAANFDAGNIRRSSVRLGLRSDSSARFEKSLDPVTAHVAARHFTALLLEMVDGCRVLSPLVDVAAPLPEKTVISLDPESVAARLGMDVPVSQTTQTLTALGFGVSPQSDNTLLVEVPSWRAGKDVAIPEDLIEEVGRIHGYVNVPPKAPTVTVKKPHLTPQKQQDRAARRYLSYACGMHETLSYAFTFKPMLERLGATLSGRLLMANSISAEWDRLRLSMIPNLLNFAEKNGRNFSAYGLYELGRVFEPVEGELPNQDRMAAFVVVHDGEMDAEAQFRQLKGQVDGLLAQLGHPHPGYRRPTPEELGWRSAWLHPARSAVVEVNDQIVGYLSLLHPNAQQVLDLPGATSLAEVNLDKLLLQQAQCVTYRPLPRYPAVQLDVSFEVDEKVTSGALQAAIVAGAGTALLENCRLFSNYHLPDGKKSVSFHLSFRSDEGSLNDQSVKPHFDSLIAHVTQSLGATLRGG